MNEMNKNLLNDEALGLVSGGTEITSEGYVVEDIPIIWVKVTASSLYCRSTPGGDVVMVFQNNQKLKVNGITSPDGMWYRVIIVDPKTGADGYGYVYRSFTEIL